MVFRVPAEVERENLLTTRDRVFRVGNTFSERNIYVNLPDPSALRTRTDTNSKEASHSKPLRPGNIMISSSIGTDGTKAAYYVWSLCRTPIGNENMLLFASQVLPLAIEQVHYTWCPTEPNQGRSVTNIT